MSEEELSKEEKLEAARKKFEELKKKTKKGKKKGKKSTKTEEVEGTPGEGENKDNSNTQPLNTEKDDTSIDMKPEEEIPTQDVTEDNFEEEENSNNFEATGSEKETPEEAIIKTDVNNKLETLVINQTGGESFVVANESDEPSQSKEEHFQLEQDQCQNETSGGEENNRSLELGLPQLTETSQSQVGNISVENEKIREELKLLKAENLELKLTKIDNDLKLEELKNEIETYKKQVERLTLQLRSVSTQHNNDEDNVSAFSEPGYLNQGISSFQNLASFNLNNGSQDYMDIVDIKERLQQWKGWNMDMHGWRSIGMGPIVEF